VVKHEVIGALERRDVFAEQPDDRRSEEHFTVRGVGLEGASSP
jgi:hypothetical protein